MSCSLWAYSPEKCEGHPCPGDCDRCAKRDIVRVIRCVDCIHFNPSPLSDHWYCSNWDIDIYNGITKASQFYCGDAERRE